MFGDSISINVKLVKHYFMSQSDISAFCETKVNQLTTNDRSFYHKRKKAYSASSSFISIISSLISPLFFKKGKTIFNPLITIKPIPNAIIAI